jgi:hypothetical protein
MIPELREEFNRRFRPEHYQRFLSELDRRSGTHVEFRNSETPCFFPRSLMDRMIREGRELIAQLSTPEYLAQSAPSVPPEYNVPNEAPHPLFIQVDFGLDAALNPKLVEIQGFPSLYAFQPVLAETYRDVYGLPANLDYLLTEDYWGLLQRAVVDDCDPAETILMEIDPPHQKTYCDFLMTEKYCGVKTVSITDIRKAGRRLYHGDTPIRRIYNRVIIDELERKQIRPAFDFRDDLEVEWAGHPNWYFRMSKFSIPFLHHPSVPRTWFLDRIDRIPDDLENYVLKPLYSFAGLGVIIGPTREQVAAVDPALYILQEKMNFAPLIETPLGPTKAEVRVMYIWTDEPRAVTTIIRTGRGKMMGVDHNRDLQWVGASAGFTPQA